MGKKHRHGWPVASSARWTRRGKGVLFNGRGLVFVTILATASTLLAIAHFRHVTETKYAVLNNQSVKIAARPIASPMIDESELKPNSLRELLQIQPGELGRVDIGRMDLLCAEGLPGAEELSIGQCSRTLDEWAKQTRFGTARQLSRFHADPKHWNYSAGIFRMDMLIATLQRHFGIRYEPRFIPVKGVPEASDKEFYSDSRTIFIHGLLTANRTGTCSSMPVLYVAVGRRLGYPLKLVLSKTHVFARWDGEKDSFNIEGTNIGLSAPTDQKYRTWPLPIDDKEITEERYLASLTPQEELSVFLGLRCCCLMSHDILFGAGEMMIEANRLAPHFKRIHVEMAELVKVFDQQMAYYNIEQHRNLALFGNVNDPDQAIGGLTALGGELSKLQQLKIRLQNPRTAP